VLAVLALVIGGAAVLSHTAPGRFLLEAFRPSKSVWRVPSAAGAAPRVYLTFDDGPNPEWTPVLLDALREEQIVATFFLIDEHITQETAPIVKRIADDGHAIGLHSGKRQLMIMPPDELAARLGAAADRITSIAGVEPCRLFRPHGGWRSASMYEGLDRIGYRLAGWSWGMWDWHWWQTPRADRTAQRLARKASPGDIIVIHDGHHANPRADRRHAAETVRLLGPALRAKGYSFGRLCDPS
jgi:peptidoglycan/xylan/chitin deacetylase (PgdA/CDA1 family)